MSGFAQFLLLGPFFHDGRLVASPLLYHYIPGTSTEKTAWEDRNQQITAANPIEGDANGLVAGYFSGLYKLEVRTHDGSVILLQKDNVQIVDPLDDTTPPVVRPEDYSGEPSASVDNTDPLRAAISALPVDGGVMQLGAGDYKFSGTLNPGNKHLIIQGAGMDATYLTMTAVTTALHGIVGTGSLTLRDLTLRTQSGLTSDYGMYGVRLNLDGTGITGGRRLHFSHVRFDGWNGAAYCDGGSGYGIELATYEHCVVLSGGEPNAHHAGSAMIMNRVQNGIIAHCNIDQNNTGEHGIYCFAARSLTIRQNQIKNATIASTQAVKVVGDGVAASGQFDRWRIHDTQCDTCAHGILIGTFGTERVKAVDIQQIVGSNIPGSSAILGGLVTVAVAGTSIIDQIHMKGLTGSELGYQAVHFTGGGGAKVRYAKIDGLVLFGWSREAASSGTYTAVGASGSAQVVDVLEIGTTVLDGDSDGRTLWNVNSFGGYGSERIGRLTLSGEQVEANTTSSEPVPAIRDATATPTLRFGQRYRLTNSAAQNVTGFVDMVQGKEYEFLVTNGNTTLKEGANLRMASNTDWNPADTDVFKLKASSATTAVESGRSDNT